MEPEQLDDICKKAKTHFDTLKATLDKLCKPQAADEATSASSATHTPHNTESDHPEDPETKTEELPDFDAVLKEELQQLLELKQLLLLQWLKCLMMR